MRGPDRLEPGDVAEARARMLGFHVEGKSTTLEVLPGAFVEDIVVGVRLRIRYDVTPEDGGVVVRHRLDALLPTGPMGRLLSLFMFWSLKRMQRRSLQALAAQSEAACGS